MNYNSIGEYCIWSDDKLINLLSNVSGKDFESKFQPDQRTLRELCEHLITSYELFFEEPSPEVYKRLMKKVNQLKHQELLNYWKNIIRKFKKGILEKNEENVKISIYGGKILNVSRSDNVLCYLLHNVYHYGQLITIYRLITGKEGVNLDYGTFVIENMEKNTKRTS